jgi:hypothetical protein
MELIEGNVECRPVVVQLPKLYKLHLWKLPDTNKVELCTIICANVHFRVQRNVIEFECRYIFSPNCATVPSRPGPPHYRGFTVTLRHTTFGRTPLDEWSARCRDLYLTTHNTHKSQTSMPPAEFEPAIPGGERPQTHALDRAATGIDVSK